MRPCRSCGAPIQWVWTVTGKAMPLDPEPHPDGNVELIDGVAHVHSQPCPDGYLSHFVTCPQGAHWRKP